MDIYTDTIRDLPAVDRLLLVERIWSDLTRPNTELPISREILEHAKARRDAMVVDPTLGKTHEQVWDRVEAWRNA
ncbi:addiction module protein [Neorhodopirellula pilleata]|uniref:Addiction module component n=1 Tax=Neorhodopirellula pilleata TaxID=2714738 RepID=A0A5C5ZGE6_9BACT|nr:addiction module protein [Neorhodopirellula pilleata]TWT86127.1 hypothetical protein Pla100_61720 [Neorhodopirellula pilleata]